MVLLAGCANVEPAPEPQFAALSGTVIGPSGPIEGAIVTLVDLGFRDVTDASGAFAFEQIPLGRACDVRVAAPGHVTKEVASPCRTELTIRLAVVAAPAPAPEVPASETPPPVTIPRYALTGSIVDDVSGTPLAGATWRLRANTTVASGATPNGLFKTDLPAGKYTLEAGAPCRASLQLNLTIESDLEVEVRLVSTEAGGTSPPVAQSTPGPSPGVATAWWSPVGGATGYQVDDGKVHDVGGARAWGDHTPSTVRVRALDACGLPGPWSDTVTMTPMAGTAIPSLATQVSANRQVTERSYPVYDGDGQPVGHQAWRVVTGTGNCCENYVATTKQGWVLDFGGSSLYLSKDEGQTWSRITPHGFQICGEGAVVPGPGGDIYAMNWEMCLGAGNDGIWALKYVAADDKWIEGSGLVHAPFFDRPWMSVLAGPHLDGAGQMSPVRSYIFTNFNDALYGQGHVVSGDGVNYLLQPPIVDSFVALEQDLPGRLAPDPDADWTQPIVQSSARQLDAGLGVMETSLMYCQLLDTEDGRKCSPHRFPIENMQRDSGGRLHAVTFNARTFTYSWSDDVGRTWQDSRHPLPPGVNGILEWDLKVSHALDRAVVAIHGAVGGAAQDYAVILRDIRTTPEIDKVMQIGGGGGTAGSGVAADVRYDFMTTGFLPDGRVVLSFTDGEFHPPAVAIELK